MAGAIVVAISALVGYVHGAAGSPKYVYDDPGESYPYALPMMFSLATAVTATGRTITRKARITLYVVAALTALLSLITYVIAYDAGRPIYHYFPAYSVYSRRFR